MKRSASFPSSRTRRRVAIALSAVFASFLAIATACSNQGEGERCETANRNDDCDTSAGLICYPSTQLNASSDRCCPADRSKATHPVCKQAGTSVTDATPPQDTGPAPLPDSGEPDSEASDAAEGGADASEAADAADQ